MRFRVDQHVAAPLARVESALFDPAFLARLAELPALGAPALLHHADDGSVVRQRVRYRFAGNLSPAVTSVVDPARLTWVEETTYDRATHRGEHVVVPDHYAGRLSCSYRTTLHALGADATRRLAEGDLRVRFPLVGGRVEKAIVSGLVEHAELEVAALTRWLSERG